MGMALLHPDLSRQHHYNPVNWPGAESRARVRQMLLDLVR